MRIRLTFKIPISQVVNGNAVEFRLNDKAPVMDIEVPSVSVTLPYGTSQKVQTEVLNDATEAAIKTFLTRTAIAEIVND